jgi:hypothetical protein
MTCVLIPSGNPSCKTLICARLKLDTTMHAYATPDNAIIA